MTAHETNTLKNLEAIPVMSKLFYQSSILYELSIIEQLNYQYLLFNNSLNVQIATSSTVNTVLLIFNLWLMFNIKLSIFRS